MKTIKTLDQLMTLLDTDSRPLFIRWSTGVANDRKMGCSTNHASGQREAGVSVNELRDTENLFNARGFVAMEVREYAHIAPVGYILTGEIVARGSDNEVVLDAETWEPVAKIAPALAESCKTIDPWTGEDYVCDHPADRCRAYTGGVVICEKCGQRVN